MNVGQRLDLQSSVSVASGGVGGEKILEFATVVMQPFSCVTGAWTIANVRTEVGRLAGQKSRSRASLRGC